MFHGIFLIQILTKQGDCYKEQSPHYYLFINKRFPVTSNAEGRIH